jgi:hypothetical protein
LGLLQFGELGGREHEVSPGGLPKILEVRVGALSGHRFVAMHKDVL